MTELKVKSLAKAMKVLECFKNMPELGVTQISDTLGLYKSNVHDILSTFEELGYIEQNPQSSKYHLSVKLLELSHAVINRMGVRNIAYPCMKELADQTGENVYFAIPYGTDVMYLDAASPRHQIYERALSGEIAPLYCTGIGKALLAFLPETEWKNAVKLPMKAFTNQTITDPETLYQELRLTRERGYSIDNMEHEYGIKCVGVPLLNDHGRAVAAISLSGPSLRFSDEMLPQYVDQLKKLAQKIRIVYCDMM